MSRNGYKKIQDDTSVYKSNLIYPLKDSHFLGYH
jgi:hypothetical protein